MKRLLGSILLLVAWLGSPAFAEGDDTGVIPKILWWQTGGEHTFAELEKIAEGGDARAKAQLGLRMMMTRERVADLDRTFALLSESAEMGDALGQTGLGWCYREGRGCAVDLEKSLEYDKKAAAQGFHHGLYQLGLTYFYGKGEEQKREEGRRLFHEAAEKGSPWAEWMITRDESLRPADWPESEVVLDRLVEKDFPAALCDKGRQLMRAGERDEGLRLVEKSARLGHDYGMRVFGNDLAWNGRALEGAEWMLESAERGSPEGAATIGKWIYEGRSRRILTGSWEAAHHFLNLSLERGVRQYDVARTMAFLNCHGQGVPVNYEKANELLELSWEMFDEAGVKHLCNQASNTSLLYVRMKPPFQDFGKALAYVQLLQHHDIESTGRIAWLHSLQVKDAPYDPVRGWAACLSAKNMKGKSPQLAVALKNLTGKLTPEQLKEAEALSAAGFPQDRKYRQEAADYLGRAMPPEMEGEFHH